VWRCSARRDWYKPALAGRLFVIASAAETTPRSKALRGIYFVPDVVRVSVIPNASASTPARTPADLSADMALGGSGHADTINSYPTRAACFTDLRDHAVRLMKRPGRHCLRRCCDGQCKDNGYEPDHSFLRCELREQIFLDEYINADSVQDGKMILNRNYE
jgi:hypothetical protein